MEANRHSSSVIHADHLTKHFRLAEGFFALRRAAVVRAVDDVSFDIQEGETFSLVGESGCGKTTTGRLILRVETPTAGGIEWFGADVNGLKGEQLRRYRMSVQAVFQDPWSSLNPRMRIGSIILEPLLFHRRLSRTEARERLDGLLVDVGISPSQASYYPHEFSGGQRQRIAIARALSLRPSLIVLDEPLSALDVSIRAQIINLLLDLQDRYGLSYLLIAHNLGLVRHMSHHVAVMYLGRVVELAPSRELFRAPKHPYTRALFASSLPDRPGVKRPEIAVLGEVPSPLDPPSGCTFHPRCPLAVPRCTIEVPALRELMTGHHVACHLAE